MKRSELIFHVGMAKTGTTSIQNFFKAHYQAALDHGVLYPRSGSSNNGLAHHSWHRSFSPLARPETEDWIEQGDPSAMLGDLEAEMHDTSPRKLLFSSESFRPESVAALLDILPHTSASVVLFIRRADHLLEAQYAQGIKTGRHKLAAQDFFDSVLKSRPDWLRPYSLLAGYAELNVKLVIQPFERAQIGGPLIYRFLEIIGESALRSLDVDLVENERLHPLVTQLLAARGGDDRLLGHKYNTLRKTLNASQLRSGADVSYSFFSPLQRRVILQEAAGDYRLIAEKLMGQPGGELFLEPVPQEDEQWQPPDQLTLSDSADMLLALWNEVWEDRQRPKK